MRTPGDVIRFKAGAVVALLHQTSRSSWRVLVLSGTPELAKGLQTYMSDLLLDTAEKVGW